MKILYVLNSAKYGGMEYHVGDLVLGMKKKGHSVFVWCPSGEMAEEYKKSGATVIEEIIKKDIDNGYISRLRNFINENEIDIVHAHELKAVANALKACDGTKAKIVTHTHTPISEWRINPLKRFLNTKFYSHVVNKYSDMEVALTESKKKVKIKEGIREDKLYVIPNGLDTSKLTMSSIQRSDYSKEIKSRHSIPDSAFVFGNLGRITKEKGHDVLVKAFKKFLDTHMFRKDMFYLLIVGGGDLEDHIRNLSKQLGIEKNVIITGKFADEDKIKYFSAFDIFLFPTLAEGFGLVLIESMFLGIPTICSDLEVLREVAGEHAEFFEVSNVDSLADKMFDVYNAVGHGENTKANKAKEYVEKTFSLEKFIENYETLYKSVLGDIK